jgi:hypothetical protein
MLWLPEEVNADVGRCGMRHEPQIGRRVDAAHVAGFDHRSELADRIGAAGTRTVRNTHFAAAHDRIVQQPGILERHFRRASRKQRNASHRTGNLAGIVRRQFEMRHRAAEPRIEIGEAIPFVHSRNAALVRAQRALDRRPIVAQGGDAADSGHDDASR